MSLAAPNVAAAPIGPATTARQMIVDALQEIPTLQVYSSSPDNPTAWDAFPRWTVTNYTGGRLGTIAVHEYDVLVILPAGYEADTVEQGDTILDAVAEVLIGIGRIDVAEPVRLTFDTGSTTPALRVHVVPNPNAPTAVTR